MLRKMHSMNGIHNVSRYIFYYFNTFTVQIGRIFEQF